MLIDLMPGERTGTNVDHFCLVIEHTDLDALAASGGLDVARGPVDGLFGAQGVAASLYVRDPDGNVVELRSDLRRGRPRGPSSEYVAARSSSKCAEETPSAPTDGS